MEKMEKNIRKDNIIKRWYKLTNPHKGLFLGQVFFYAGYTIFLTIITIFAARTINCMYKGNWGGAFLNLGIELFTIIMRNIFLHIEYKFYNKQVTHIRLNVADKMYNKILSSKSSQIKDMSKERIINIALNNMSNLSEFPDSVAVFIGYSLQVAFTLITVFVANWLAGIAIMLLGVVNFFVYYSLNKRLGRLMLARYEKKDEMYSTYNKVIDGKSVINELNGRKKYRKEILKVTKEYGDAYAKYYTTYSYKNNLYWATWNVVVYGLAALMLYFVSKGTLDIAIYLIIVPYLSSCTDSLCDLFDKTNNIENMRVDVDRVNLILGLTDKQLINYGKINTDSQGYNLGFMNVTCEKKSAGDIDIKDVNISFKMNSINVVKGESGSGKRVVFDLLRRYRKPDTGIVLLDNLDLYDYNQKTFKHHIDYCASHPDFIEGSIKENLQLVDKKMSNIVKVCEQVGVLKQINKLKNGFETLISDIKNTGTLFLIGLVRSILSNSNVLMIYEIPQDQDDAFRKNVVNLLTKYDINKTIILFTHSNDYDCIASKIYEVKKGVFKLSKDVV